HPPVRPCSSPPLHHPAPYPSAPLPLHDALPIFFECALHLLARVTARPGVDLLGLQTGLRKDVLTDALPGELALGDHLLHLRPRLDRKSTRLNSSHVKISYAVFRLKKQKHE